MAVIRQDALLPNAITKGASELAKSKGLELVFLETYRSTPEDFSDLVSKAAAAKPDVLVAASIRFEDLLAITRKLKELVPNLAMVSAVPYGHCFPIITRSSRKTPSLSTVAPSGTRLFHILAIESLSRPT
jgi:hypothetical protein